VKLGGNLGRLLKLDPTRSDQRWRLPYGWEIKDWFDAHIFPMPPYKSIMFDYDSEHPGRGTFNEQNQWWDEWHRRATTQHRFRYWLHWTFSLFLSHWKRKLIHDPYWWARHRIDPRHRYHIIRTGLPAGYWDPDSRLLHAVMNTVQEFVESTENVVAWDTDHQHRRVWKVLTEAVVFWKEYQAFQKDETRWAGDDREAHHRAWEAEHEMEKRADAHLAKIMKVRQYLWYP
jgi:hypothetical protein